MHTHEWEEIEGIYCETCGDHDGLRCTICGEVVDLVWDEDPREDSDG